MLLHCLYFHIISGLSKNLEAFKMLYMINPFGMLTLGEDIPSTFIKNELFSETGAFLLAEIDRPKLFVPSVN